MGFAHKDGCYQARGTNGKIYEKQPESRHLGWPTSRWMANCCLRHPADSRHDLSVQTTSSATAICFGRKIGPSYTDPFSGTNAISAGRGFAKLATTIQTILVHSADLQICVGQAPYSCVALSSGCTILCVKPNAVDHNLEFSASGVPGSEGSS